MKTGALQPSPERQLITPFPYSPPTMMAAFFKSGITATQRARSHAGCGIEERLARNTCAPSERRATSCGSMAALAVTAASTAMAVHVSSFMVDLSLLRCKTATDREPRGVDL